MEERETEVEDGETVVEKGEAVVEEGGGGSGGRGRRYWRRGRL